MAKKLTEFAARDSGRLPANPAPAPKSEAAGSPLSATGDPTGPVVPPDAGPLKPDRAAARAGGTACGLHVARSRVAVPRPRRARWRS